MTSAISDSGLEQTAHGPTELVLVSTAEFALKSAAVRRRLHSQLTEHMKLLLKRNGIKTVRTKIEGGRIILEPDRDPEKAAHVCSRVFGVAWVAHAFLVPSDKQLISELCLRLAESKLEPGISFAVRARRSRDFVIGTRDFERYLGQEILRRFSTRGLRVNLDNPRVTFHVELGSEKSFVYLTRIRGPAGLPVGSQGKMLGLVRQLDSAGLAAFHKMMRRGASIVPVSFLDPQSTIQYLIPLRMLLPKETYHFWHVSGLERIVDQLPTRGTTSGKVVLARLMMRVLSHIARREKAVGIVDTQLQTSAESLSLMKALSPLGLVPVHRPLVGFPENEVYAYARSFGLESEASSANTFPLAENAAPFDFAEVLRLEETLGIEKLAERLFLDAQKVLVPLGYENGTYGV